MQIQMFSVYPIALNYLKQKIESRALELIPRCGLFNTFWNLFGVYTLLYWFAGSNNKTNEPRYHLQFSYNLQSKP